MPSEEGFFCPFLAGFVKPPFVTIVVIALGPVKSLRQEEASFTVPGNLREGGEERNHLPGHLAQNLTGLAYV